MNIIARKLGYKLLDDEMPTAQYLNNLADNTSLSLKLTLAGTLAVIGLILVIAGILTIW